MSLSRQKISLFNFSIQNTRATFCAIFLTSVCFFSVLDFFGHNTSHLMLFPSFKRHQWDSCFIVCWIQILKWCYWSCFCLPCLFLFTSDGMGQDCFLSITSVAVDRTASHHWVLLCNQLIVQVSLTPSVLKSENLTIKRELYNVGYFSVSVVIKYCSTLYENRR